MKRIKSEKGITLISLIITVLVLIALIGLIEIIVPDDAFRKAEEVKEETEQKVKEQQNVINEVANFPDVPNE